MSAVVSALAVVAPARRRSWTLVAGLVLVGAVVLVAVISLVWLPYAPADTTGTRLEGPSLAHWIGTDKLGRDLATQLMSGARIALLVGLSSVAVGAVIGITVGLVAAFAES
jgi:peptide/nickel transport system permease protein